MHQKRTDETSDRMTTGTSVAGRMGNLAVESSQGGQKPAAKLAAKPALPKAAASKAPAASKATAKPKAGKARAPAVVLTDSESEG